MDPFDFIVPGIPRSVNAASRSLTKWKENLVKTGKAVWPDGQPMHQGELTVKIVFYYSGETSLDVDNIIKPVVDSMKGLVFDDDKNVFEVTCRKTPQGPETRISDAPPCLVEALGTIEDFLFIRVGDGPNHTELPR